MAKTPKKWNVYGRFCELIHEAFQSIVPNDALDDVCLTDIPLMKKLYCRFKTETLANKSFKGFPTNSGHRKSEKGFPLTTIVPKEHPEIVRLFHNFITKNKAELEKIILAEFEKFPNLDDSISDPGGTDVDSSDSVDETSFTQLGIIIKQESSTKQEKAQKRKRFDLNITSPNKEKKLEPSPKEENNQQVEISKDFVIDVKKSIKKAMIRDGEIQSQAMKYCNEELNVLKSQIQTYEPLLNDSLVILQRKKEAILKRMGEELEKVEFEIVNLKENALKHFGSLKELVNFLEKHIARKESEFKSLKEREEEELDEFFNSHK